MACTSEDKCQYQRLRWAQDGDGTGYQPPAGIGGGVGGPASIRGGGRRQGAS